MAPVAKGEEGGASGGTIALGQAAQHVALIRGEFAWGELLLGWQGHMPRRVTGEQPLLLDKPAGEAAGNRLDPDTMTEAIAVYAHLFEVHREGGDAQLLRVESPFASRVLGDPICQLVAQGPGIDDPGSFRPI